MHLIWSILNVVILLYFFYLIFGFIARGRRIFIPQFKIVSILIMVFGIAQIVFASTSENESNNIILTEDYRENSNVKIQHFVLEESISMDINMKVKYAVDQAEFTPIVSSSYLTGMVSGFTWEFTSVSTEHYSADEKVEFVAKGVLNWKLFGFKL